MIKRLSGLAAAIAVLVAWAFENPAESAVINTDVTTTVGIPGVAQFATDGADMVGMLITATFEDGFSETISWQATGAASGAAFGTDWTITEAGDTFATNAWSFLTNRNSDLVELIFDGAPGLTLFDLGVPDPGTPGSASGKDFATSLADDGMVVATYSNVIASGGNPAVGDLFQLLTVDFSDIEAMGNFTFSQDTDNDARRVIMIPAPSGTMLFASAILGIGFVRYQQRRAA